MASFDNYLAPLSPVCGHMRRFAGTRASDSVFPVTTSQLCLFIAVQQLVRNRAVRYLWAILVAALGSPISVDASPPTKLKELA